MVLVAPRSAKLVEARGARVTLLVGYVFCLLGFLVMLLLWKEDISYWKVGLGYALDRDRGRVRRHAGLALADGLGARSQRAGMASGTADLQRDLGGAIMQSILGALLTAGYAAAAAAAIAAAPNRTQINDKRPERAHEVVLERRRHRGQQYPQYANEIIAGAKSSFLQGDEWAYAAGIVAIVLGAALVFFLLPEQGGGAAAARVVRRRGFGSMNALTTLAASSELLPARSQMAFTLGFHIVLASLGVGFPALMLIANYIGPKRDDDDVALGLARTG